MNSYCAPAEGLHEEFSVTGYKIPEELKEKVEADIDEANGEEVYDYIETLAKGTPAIEFAIVDVAYTADDIKATAR